MQTQGRILGLFSLAMINVAAIVSLRNLSVMVEYGFSAIFFYILAALLFFIPTALCCAELATGWPKEGGIYTWVSEAFGKSIGFIAIWMAWMLSISWFPTVLIFTAGGLAYLISPELIHNKVYMISMILLIFWGATFVNFLGMRISSLISTIGVLLGTIIPGFLIIGLGCLWFYLGKDLKIEMSWTTLLPDFRLENMVLVVGAVLSFAGIEIAAFHAKEATNPQQNYPRAILLSTIIILLISILGSLSIAMVIEPTTISLFSGLMQAFNEFFQVFHLGWAVKVVAAFAVIGSLAGVNTWIIGPAKGILVSAADGFLPPWMHKINERGMPVGTLLVQAVLGSILTLIIAVMPNINSAFWVITVLTAQFAMIMYILIFAAAIKLRYSQSHVPRAYRVPGGKIGMWFVSGMGIVTCLFVFFIGFIPPFSHDIGHVLVFQGYLIFGLLLLSLPPVYFIWFKKPHWHVELF